MEGLKRNDYLLAAAILLAALLLFLLLSFGMAPGARIRIQVDGEEYGVYSLAEEQKIQTGDGNTVQIQNGAARMEWADCPDQLCLHQREISRSGETIVCLPNRIIITVLGGEESSLDGIAG